MAGAETGEESSFSAGDATERILRKTTLCWELTSSWAHFDMLLRYVDNGASGLRAKHSGLKPCWSKPHFQEPNLAQTQPSSPYPSVADDDKSLESTYPPSCYVLRSRWERGFSSFQEFQFFSRASLGERIAKLGVRVKGKSQRIAEKKRPGARFAKIPRCEPPAWRGAVGWGLRQNSSSPGGFLTWISLPSSPLCPLSRSPWSSFYGLRFPSVSCPGSLQHPLAS